MMAASPLFLGSTKFTPDLPPPPLPSFAVFADLEVSPSSLKPPEPPVPPDPPDLRVASILRRSFTPSLSESNPNPFPELRCSFIHHLSGLWLGLAIFSALMRIFAALCRFFPKKLFRLSFGLCYGYQSRIWFIKLTVSYLLGLLITFTSLVKGIVRRLKKISKPIKVILALWLVIVPFKDPVVCKPWVPMGNHCRDYSLVEKLFLSYPPFERRVCVAGIKFVFRVVKLSNFFINELGSTFHNTLDVPLLFGLGRLQVSSFALLANFKLLKTVLECLSLSPLVLRGLVADCFQKMSVLTSGFDMVFDMLNVPKEWGFVASAMEAVFQHAISFFMAGSTLGFCVVSQLYIYHGIRSSLNNIGVELRGLFNGFVCFNVSISFYCFFISHSTFVALMILVWLNIVNTFSFYGE